MGLLFIEIMLDLSNVVQLDKTSLESFDLNCTLKGLEPATFRWRTWFLLQRFPPSRIWPFLTPHCWPLQGIILFGLRNHSLTTCFLHLQPKAWKVRVKPYRPCWVWTQDTSLEFISTQSFAAMPQLSRWPARIGLTCKPIKDQMLVSNNIIFILQDPSNFSTKGR